MKLLSLHPVKLSFELLTIISFRSPEEVAVEMRLGKVRCFVAGVPHMEQLLVFPQNEILCCFFFSIQFLVFQPEKAQDRSRFTKRSRIDLKTVTSSHFFLPQEGIKLRD